MQTLKEIPLAVGNLNKAAVDAHARKHEAKGSKGDAASESGSGSAVESESESEASKDTKKKVFINLYRTYTYIYCSVF